jgi:hypothetical protein
MTLFDTFCVAFESASREIGAGERYHATVCRSDKHILKFKPFYSVHRGDAVALKVAVIGLGFL